MKKQVEVNFVLEFDHDQEKQYDACCIDKDKAEEILVEKVIEKIFSDKEITVSEVLEWMVKNMDGNCLNFILLKHIQGILHKIKIRKDVIEALKLN